MLRLHLTAHDVARLHVTELGPLAECQLALGIAQRRAGGALWERWRARVRHQLRADARSLAVAWAEPGLGLDLYTTVGHVLELGEGIDRLLSGPARLRAELPLYPAGFHARQAEWMDRGIGGGGPASVRLGAALTAAHDAALAAHWHRVQTLLAAERVLAGRVMAAQGVLGLVERLAPWARWTEADDGPVLEIDYRSYAGVRDMQLRGGGLAVALSFFAGRPQVFGNPDSELLLIFPVARDPATLAAVLTPEGLRPAAALAALVGRTRAAVLAAVQDGATTGEIARRLHIAPASASKHTTVLREAGLIASRRDRERVWHSLTPAGLQLLDGPGGAARRRDSFEPAGGRPD
ncbi:ArsR/SmtB family transcription factor [Streptomyces xanthochromogenes]|uniref:ArsR/SmtB family transcription factor n=1 Tax=Streptomyces xanthochromogenes TaxID=67384 RepID=UPI0034185AE7